jgi:putative peptidoglycan lipid II flippase
MLRGVLTVGGWTMASRILGFARDMMIAALLGEFAVANSLYDAM